jgi:oligosaccharyl transferase (archaeosortase A-associated)
MRKIQPRLLIGILIAISVGVSLIYRVLLPYDLVFSGDWVKFTSVDGYYHMRLIDNLVHNFPNLTHFDPFFIYPGGVAVGGVHFFDWLLSGIIWVIGLGSPTQHTVDVVGAYFPAILAALTVIPVYFIGKALFNRWAGVIAAALTAVLPGEYIGRSILGFTDHHVAETLFSTVTVLFLILAIKEAGQRKLTFAHLIQRDWAVTVRPLVYSLLAGVFLGLYLNTWLGGSLFVFIIALYLIIQFIINHLRRKSSEHLGIVGVIFFLVALIIFLPFSPAMDLSVSMVVALFIPLVLSGFSVLMSAKGLKPYYYPLTMIGVGVIFVVILNLIVPGILGAILAKFGSVFIPAGATATTTLEMQPFLSPQGSFSTLVAWGNFTTSFFLTKPWPIPGFALISFVILIYLYIKRRSDEEHWLLFLVWTLVILVATLVQRRFAYYLVINIALLSAYISWQIIWLAGLRRLVARTEEIREVWRTGSKKDRKEKRHEESQGITIYHVNTTLAIIVVFVLVFLFNIFQAKDVASQTRFAPTDAWQASLSWMKENTPDPFDDPDAYYKLYEVPPPGEGFQYPESAYGVTSWWDYGYWISRIANRLPSVNPSQAAEPITKVAKAFLSQEESTTQEIMEEMESSYIIADYAMTTSKYWAILTWSGLEESEFTDIYHFPSDDQYIPIRLFNPGYYSSMLVRLYNFDGEAVTTENPVVIAYDEKVDREGNRHKIITDMEQFSSYQEALDYVESQGAANHRIVGINPFVSPISLEAVQNYKMVYSSESCISHRDAGMIPEVKIFEYIR